MKEDKTHINLGAWDQGVLHEDEVRELAKHYDLNKLKKNLKQLEKYKYPKYDKEKAWNELQNKLDKKKKKIKTVKLSWLYQAAAILLISFGIYWLMSEKAIIIRTEYAETKEVILPDSSIILMNAGSEISYYKSSWNENRMIELSGEAHFSVKKGSKFTVNSKQASVEVLGTKFNIKERNEQYQVYCYEGKVRVYTQEQEQILTKGKAVELQNTDLKLFLFPDSTANWLNNKLVYEDIKLALVLQELEIQYNFVFNMESNTRERVFTGNLPLDNLEKAMKIISKALGLNYEIKNEEKRVYVSEKK